MSKCGLCLSNNTQFSYNISPNSLPEQITLNSFNSKLTNGKIDNNGNSTLYACNEHNSKLYSLIKNSSLPIFFTIK